MSNVSQSKVMSKLKAKAKGAWNRARKVEAKGRGGGGFPPNLKNLVAVCQSYAFKETKQGDPFIQLNGVVKDPEELQGRKAVFMWFINESDWATIEDNLNQLSNDLQLLGLEMPEDLADLPPLLADICERGVHFLFNTGGQPKNTSKTPRLYIQGLAEDWEDNPEPTDDPNAQDDTQSDEDGQNADSGEGDAEGDGTDDAGDQAADDAPWEPAKGDEYNYTPPKEKKAHHVKVIAVDKKKETFDLQTTKKPAKTFKAVKWHKADGEPSVEAL